MGILSPSRNRLLYLNFRDDGILAAVATVGAHAGVTRAVQNRIKVSHSPPVYIYDTPGILTPSIPDVETGMRLAVCGKKKYEYNVCRKSGMLNHKKSILGVPRLLEPPL